MITISGFFFFGPQLPIFTFIMRGLNVKIQLSKFLKGLILLVNTNSN